MIMGLLGVSCCGHPALSPRLGTGGQCGVIQLLACTKGTSSPALSASPFFYEALMVGLGILVSMLRRQKLWFSLLI